MSKEKKIPEKTDQEILIPEVTINKYTVEPWGLKEIVKVTPVIIGIIDKCKKNGVKITVDNCMVEIPKALPYIVDDMYNIIAITIGVDIKEIENIKPRSDSVMLILTIIQQNLSYLKNLPGLLPSVIRTVLG